MAFLRVFTFDSVHDFIVGVINGKLLELLCETATVENGIFHNFPHILVLIVHPNLRPIIRRKTKVKIPKRNIRRMIIVVLANNSPRPMAGGNENSMEETDFFFESEVDVAFVVESLVGGVESVLIGEVAGHEGEADAEGDWDGVVAVLEGVGHLAQDEVLLVFEAAPVEHVKFFWI